MKLAIYSDLHIEGSEFKPNVDNADIIILAGDIFALGQAKKNSHDNVIDWMGDKFYNKTILFVPGNHDFEDSRVDEQMEIWKNIINDRHQNIHLMWDDVVDINGVRFLGTPLFSNFASTGNPKMAKEHASLNVVDFRKILLGDRLVTPDDYIKWCHQSYGFLDRELHKDMDIPKIVITHFAPSLSMNGERINGINSAYFCNTFENLVEKSNYWFSGHTHYSHKVHLGNDPNKGHLISNARGYSKTYNLSSDANFRDDFIIDISHLKNQLKNNKKPSI